VPTSTTFCVCCRNDVVGVVAECNNEQQQQQHSNDHHQSSIMNTDCTETTTSLTNIDGDLAYDNGAPSGMKPSKKSRVSWPKMRAVKTDATGRCKHLYPFLDDNTNQKDTWLVVLLLELAPYKEISLLLSPSWALVSFCPGRKSNHKKARSSIPRLETLSSKSLLALLSTSSKVCRSCSVLQDCIVVFRLVWGVVEWVFHRTR
jgi:hypothetical protein